VQKPVIYYICPKKHRIDLYASYKKDVFCKQCDCLVEKTKCTRIRDYVAGTRVLREANQKPYTGRYSHEYYLRRKNGLCKKQLHPHKHNNNNKDVRA
jgi:hypothetical protein